GVASHVPDQAQTGNRAFAGGGGAGRGLRSGWVAPPDAGGRAGGRRQGVTTQGAGRGPTTDRGPRGGGPGGRPPGGPGCGAGSRTCQGPGAPEGAVRHLAGTRQGHEGGLPIGNGELRGGGTGEQAAP